MEASAAGAGRRNQGSRRPRRLAAGGGLALLAALAVLLLVFRDRGLEGAGTAEPFRYEQGANQVFCAAGSGLAVASSSAVELLDRSGDAVFRQVVSWEAPMVSASGSGALFCEIGGTGCILADFSGTERRLRPAGNILTAHRNEDGWTALVTEEPGYKAKVTVYDPQGTAKFFWWSGTGYVLRACVGPDNRLLAVLCGVNGGGVLHLFRTDSEEELAAAEFRGELPFDLAFLGEGRLCTVSSTGMNFLDTAGTLLNRYDFGGKTLLDYSLSSQELAAVCLGSGAGGGSLLAALDREGRLTGSAELGQTVVSLSAAGRRVLVLTTGGLTLCDRSLTPVFSDDTARTARQALLRSDGDALLLSAGGAEWLHIS